MTRIKDLPTFETLDPTNWVAVDSNDDLETSGKASPATLAAFVNSDLAPVLALNEGVGISISGDPQNPTISSTGSGVGDMLSAIYDPQDISNDAFDLANHTGELPPSSVNELTLTRRLSARVGALFDTVSDLIADTTLTYANVSPGDIIEAQGFRYEVVAGDATNYHVETEGGVRLNVLPINGAVNLLAFGPDGTNDTAVFDAADATGFDLLLHRGTTLTLNGATLTGKKLLGYGTIAKHADASVGLFLTGNNPVVKGVTFDTVAAFTGGFRDNEVKVADGCTSPKFKDCIFTSQASVYSAVIAADDPDDTSTDPNDFPYTNDVRDLTIQNCLFIGNYARPVMLSCVEGYSIVDNYFTGCRFDAIRAREACRDGIISRNYFYEVGDQSWPDEQTRDCIDTAFGGGKLTITDNTMIRPAYVGVDIKGVDRIGDGYHSNQIIVSGNYIEGARKNGISIAESNLSGSDFIYGFDVSNNFVISCNQENATGTGAVSVAGIQLGQNAGFATIRGNHVYGCFGYGIILNRDIANSNNTRNTIVDGNIVFNNTEYGIYAINPINAIITGNLSGNDTTNYATSPASGQILPVTPGQNEGFRFIGSDSVSRYSCIFTGNQAIDNLAVPIGFGGSGTYADLFAKYADNYYVGAQSDLGSTNRTRWARPGARIFWGNGSPPVASEGTFKRGDIIYNEAPLAGGSVGLVCTTGGSPGEWKNFGDIEA